MNKAAPTVIAILLFVFTAAVSLDSRGQTQVNSSWAFQNQNQQNTGYSPQTLIDSSNVGTLSLVWATHIPAATGSAVVVNKIVYMTGGGSIWALDELTGKIIWADGPGKTTNLHYSTRVGVTVDGGNVYTGTSNNLLVSLNAATGNLQWTSSITQGIVGSSTSYAGIEATPLAFQGKLIVGETSGDGGQTGGIRGFVRAFSESNGQLLWTFYTVPPSPITPSNQGGYANSWGTNGTNGCDCGGGAVWNVPAVDPATGIIYFGTGNPSPAGSLVKVRTPNAQTTNLYTDSIVAINSADGSLVWYFQMTPGDQRDYDQGMPVQLFTTMIHGEETQVVGAGSKNGYYFVVNADDGSFIYKVKIGMHENDNSTQGSVPGSQIYPGPDGGVDSFSAFNPETNMIYTTAYNEPEDCDITITVCPTLARNATLYAIDASTGMIAWSKFMPGPGLGGGSSTTGNIVFTADGNHNFYALNALNGSVLWTRHDPTGGTAGVWYWSWGAPSIVDGMVFETTMGTGTDGQLEAFAAANTTSSTSTSSDSSAATTLSSLTTSSSPETTSSSSSTDTTFESTTSVTTETSDPSVTTTTTSLVSVTVPTISTVSSSSSSTIFTTQSNSTETSSSNSSVTLAPSTSSSTVTFQKATTENKSNTNSNTSVSARSTTATPTKTELSTITASTAVVVPSTKESYSTVSTIQPATRTTTATSTDSPSATTFNGQSNNIAVGIGVMVVVFILLGTSLLYRNRPTK